MFFCSLLTTEHHISPWRIDLPPPAPAEQRWCWKLLWWPAGGLWEPLSVILWCNSFYTSQVTCWHSPPTPSFWCPHKNLSYANFLVNTLKSGWILSLNTIHYLKMQGNFAEILKSMDLLGNFKFRIRKKLISPETLRQTSMELCSVPFGDSETRLRALLQSMIYSPYKWNFAIQQNFVMRMHCHAIVCFTNVAQQIPEPLKINICKRFMKFNFSIIYTMLLCFH